MQTHEVDRLAEEIFIRRVTEEKIVMSQPNATLHAATIAQESYILAEVFLATQAERTTRS